MNNTPLEEHAQLLVERYLVARYSMDEHLVREEAKLDEFFAQASARRSQSQKYLIRRSVERVMRLESNGALVHVFTSGEGMGEKRYTVANQGSAFKIEEIEYVCVSCDGTGCSVVDEPNPCSMCEGTGWIDAGG